MRTRKEVLRDTKDGGGFVEVERYQLALIVETLVDIRDLLAREKEEPTPQGEGCGIGCKDPNCPDKYLVKKSPQGDSIVEEV